MAARVRCNCLPRRRPRIRSSQRGLRAESKSMKNIYVGNLTFDATADDLRELFEQYGRVAKAQVVSDRETGRSRGFGFVEMEDGGDEAVAALNGTQYKGRSLTVNEAKPREDRGGGGGRGGGYGGGGGGGRGGYGGGRDRY